MNDTDIIYSNRTAVMRIITQHCINTWYFLLSDTDADTDTHTYIQHCRVLCRTYQLQYQVYLYQVPITYDGLL
jgi:hypothetical protein